MIRVNLIPESVQFAQQRRYRAGLWAVAVLGTLTAVAVAGGLEWYRRVEARDLSGLASELRVELARARADVKALTLETQNVCRHIERATALKSKRAWSGLFATIGARMPQPCWLVSMSTDPPTPTGGASGSTASGPTSAATDSSVKIEAPRRLKLVGYAPEAADPHVFVTNLKDTDLFTRVRLERSTRELALDGSYFKFELVCEW